MIVEIVIASVFIVTGYVIRLGHERIKVKYYPKERNETDMLLDEIESCSEMSDVKLIGGAYEKRREITMVNGIIIEEGRLRFSSGNWNKSPGLFVKDKGVTLTVKQDDRVHALVNYKHAEYGRQQITEKLITR